MYLKRQKTPKSWPVVRKGTKYVVRPSHDLAKGIPLLIVLRDILGVAKNRKEAKKILNEGKVLVNSKVRKDVNLSLSLFDILKIGDEKYQVVFKNKKISVERTDSEKRTAKIIGIKILKKGRMQINLMNGENFLYDKKVKVGDSVLLEDNKIIKILELKKGSKVLAIKGKHLGEFGIIKEIENKVAEIESNGEKIKVGIRNLMAIE